MIRIRILWLLAALIAASAGLIYVGRQPAAGVAGSPAASTTGARSMVLATTTSVQDSGLLDELLPRFESRTGIYVRVKAVGSGKALELGRIGEADAVLCHSPELEEAFLREGRAESRKPVARNEYLVVGPAADPAGVQRASTAAGALKAVAAARAPFVSRGDGSGTHGKEMDLWNDARIQPAGGWYHSVDAGMGAVLRRASDLQGYTLTDAATFTVYRNELQLQVLHRGSAGLDNPYSILVVAPEARPSAALADARRFADFLTGPEGQALIAGYGAAKFGRALFEPAGR